MNGKTQPIVLEFTVTAAVATDLDAAARKVADDGLNGRPYTLDRTSTATADVIDISDLGERPGSRTVNGRWSAEYQATEVLGPQP